MILYFWLLKKANKKKLLIECLELGILVSMGTIISKLLIILEPKSVLKYYLANKCFKSKIEDILMLEIKTNGRK